MIVLLGEYGYEEECKNIQRCLEGKTYLSFEITLQKNEETWSVYVKTQHKHTTELEMFSMIAYTLGFYVKK